MVFINVQRNKSLAGIKENCTLDGRSYCDILTCYNLLYGMPGRGYPYGVPGRGYPYSTPTNFLRKETLGTKYYFLLSSKIFRYLTFSKHKSFISLSGAFYFCFNHQESLQTASLDRSILRDCTGNSLLRSGHNEFN